MNAQSVAAAPVVGVNGNRFVAQVYMLMTLELVVTSLTSTAIAAYTAFILRPATSPWLAFGSFIVQSAIVKACRLYSIHSFSPLA
jgi:FtsH-binding integral membrane protein